MRIYENLIPKVSKEFIKKSINNGYLLIDKANYKVAQSDIESIFKAYLLNLKDIYRLAKQRIEKADELDRSVSNKIRKQIAAEKKFPLEKYNEEYLVKQLLAILFQSDSIDDIMVDDNKIKKLFLEICNRFFITTEELNREVEKRMFYVLEYFPRLKKGSKEWKDKERDIRTKLEVAKGLRNPEYNERYKQYKKYNSNN
jgi:hypothetical protein